MSGNVSCNSEYRGAWAGKSRLLSRAAGSCALAIAFLAVVSCARGPGQEKVILPPTPVLSIRSTWAVVKSPLLRIREEPSNKSTVLSHIRMGTVVEVIAKSDKEETIEEEVSYWYRIN